MTKTEARQKAWETRRKRYGKIGYGPGAYGMNQIISQQTNDITAERDALRAENKRLREVNSEALARLTVLVEAFNDDCRLDHHGFCQAHLVTKPCEIAEARAFLARDNCQHV